MGGRFSRRKPSYDPYNEPYNDPFYPDVPPPGYPGYGGPLNRYGTGFGGGFGPPPPYGYQRRGYPMGGFDDPYETYGYGGYMTEPYESLGPYGRGSYGGRYGRGKFLLIERERFMKILLCRI